MAKRKPTLAGLLRRLIRESGLSARKLAAETGVKQQTISEFLRGKDVRLGTAQKLMDHFGVTFETRSVN